MDYLNIGISRKNIREIKAVQFGIPSDVEITLDSTCKVKKTSLKNVKKVKNTDVDTKNPSKQSVYDKTMGVIENNDPCVTCGCDVLECPGHFGRIHLNDLIIHSKFLKQVVDILKCVCEKCSTSLISKEEAELLGLMRYKMKDRLENFVKVSIKISKCSKCNNPCPKYSSIVKDIVVKKSYLKKIWIAIIVIAGLSFILGQFAIYLFSGF